MRKTYFAILFPVLVYVMLWAMTYASALAYSNNEIRNALEQRVASQNQGGKAVRVSNLEAVYTEEHIADHVNIYYCSRIRSYAPFHAEFAYAYTVQGASCGMGSSGLYHKFWLFGYQLRDSIH